MKTVKLTAAVLAVLAMTLVGSTPAAAQDEDTGSNVISTPSGLAMEIPGMTIPNIVFDFDALPAGPVTVADMQTAFPGSALANITITPRAATGGYNFQTGGGRALAGNTDLSGSLFLVDPPAGVFGEADDVTITLSELTTEVGFEIGDWAGPFNCNLFDGAAPVGSVQVSTVGDVRTHFVGSDIPFDTIVLTANPDNPPANWVVPTLYIAEGTQVNVLEIPTLGTVGLALLVLVLAGLAIMMLRRRRTA